MPTPTKTFRLGPREVRELSRLAEELACSETDVVRNALKALRKDEALRSEIRAASFADAFLARLKKEHGPDARLEFETHQESVVPTIGGVPAQNIAIRPHQLEPGLLGLDLIDTSTGVAISNAYTVENDEPVHVVIPLRYFWFASPAKAAGEREIFTDPDGKTVVEITEDDGVTRRYVLGSDGSSAALRHEPRAELEEGA